MAPCIKGSVFFALPPPPPPPPPPPTHPRLLQSAAGRWGWGRGVNDVFVG